MFACAFCPFCSFTIFHPSCCHHLLSSPSIRQQPMLSKTIRLVFFLLLILYKRASVLLHVFLLHSPLSVPLFSTPSWWQRVRAVRPNCYSNFPDGPSSRTMMVLYQRVVSVCVCVRACFVAVFVCSFTSYHRAIWDAEEHSLHVSASVFFNLPQGESICHDGGRCCCCFRAHSITERSH